MLSSDVSSKSHGHSVDVGQFGKRHHLIEHRGIAIREGNVIAVLRETKRNLRPSPVEVPVTSALRRARSRRHLQVTSFVAARPDSAAAR